MGVVFSYEMKDGAVSCLKYKEKFVCWLLSNLCTWGHEDMCRHGDMRPEGLWVVMSDGLALKWWMQLALVAALVKIWGLMKHTLLFRNVSIHKLPSTIVWEWWWWTRRWWRLYSRVVVVVVVMMIEVNLKGLRNANQSWGARSLWFEGVGLKTTCSFGYVWSFIETEVQIDILSWSLYFVNSIHDQRRARSDDNDDDFRDIYLYSSLPVSLG